MAPSSRWARSISIRRSARSVACASRASRSIAYPVTNDAFARFVDDTGYVTVAERPIDPAQYPGAIEELCVPGSLVFRPTSGPVDLNDWSQWWEWTPGAMWRRPLGPQIIDVTASRTIRSYTSPSKTRKPTRIGPANRSRREAEWEYAARGGLEKKHFTWGDEMMPGGKIMANTWQGEFPWQNLELDGFARTSPVGTFPPNGYGLYDMAGNVWEWTTDWYAAQPGAVSSKPCCGGGSSQSKATIQISPNVRIPRKVVKGGSHLVRAELLLAFSPCGPLAADGRYLDEPSRLSLHHAADIKKKRASVRVSAVALPFSPRSGSRSTDRRCTDPVQLRRSDRRRFGCRPVR